MNAFIADLGMILALAALLVLAIPALRNQPHGQWIELAWALVSLPYGLFMLAHVIR